MHLSKMKEASIHATPFLENQPSNVIPLPPSPPKQKSILSYIQVCYQYVQQRKETKDTSDIDNYSFGEVTAAHFFNFCVVIFVS
jgi:hypothetical protein